MRIREGYNRAALELHINGRKNANAELWIVQNGLPETCSTYRETLSYASLQELAELKREIEDAILEIVGINRDI
jgi:hypothetical protein